MNNHSKKLLELCDAGGPIEEIKNLLDQGGDVNTRDLHDHPYFRGDKKGSGNTLLHKALKSKQCTPELLTLLLERGAEVNTTGRCGGGSGPDSDHTLLELAAYGTTSPESIKVLLDYGADVNHVGYIDHTALDWAIGHAWRSDESDIPNPEVVSLLIEYGAELNRVYKGTLSNNVECNSTLYALNITSSTSVSILKILIDAGLQINDTANTNGGTLLPSVCYKSNPNAIEMTKILLDAGADIDQLGTCLINTSKEEPPTATLKRAEKYGDVEGIHARLKDGGLYYCPYVAHEKRCESRECEEWPDGLMSDIFSWHRHQATWPETTTHSNYDLITFLLENGADINAKDGDNKTALHYALEHKDNIEVIKLLLNAGADLHDSSIFTTATVHQSSEVLNLLKEFSGSIEITDPEYVPLIVTAAAENKDPNMLLSLIQSGEDVNAISKKHSGGTALHEALTGVNSDNFAMHSMLIGAGADLSAKNKFGRTPLHQACQSGAD